MAVLHCAWVFDVDHAHREIASACVSGRQVDRAALVALAESAMTRAPLDYREMIRFDQEWLTDPEYSLGHLYVAAQGAFLEPAPAIDSPLIAQHYLSTATRDSELATRIVRGDPLSTLRYRFQDELIGSIGQDLSYQFGGWLAAEAIDGLTEHLERAKARAQEPDPSDLVFVFGSGHVGPAAAASVRRSLQAADACLRFAASRGAALRCVVD